MHGCADDEGIDVANIVAGSRQRTQRCSYVDQHDDEEGVEEDEEEDDDEEEDRESEDYWNKSAAY